MSEMHSVISAINADILLRHYNHSIFTLFCQMLCVKKSMHLCKQAQSTVTDFNYLPDDLLSNKLHSAVFHKFFARRVSLNPENPFVLYIINNGPDCIHTQISFILAHKTVFP